MHRFYLPPSECRGPSLYLSGREAHHALHVLRLQLDEPVTVLDGEGSVLHCKVSEAGRNQLKLAIIEERTVPPLPYAVTLAQAIPKGKLFEDIVQKATELGASRIVPLVTERVVAKPRAEDFSHKVQKWTQAAIEAIKQCGSAWLPDIVAPTPIEKFLTMQSEVDLALVGSLAPGSPHAKLHFEDFLKTNSKRPATISVAIGPEGDFTPQELSAIETAGARPITLGPLVLRTETAAIYCLSIINYELQWRS